MENFLYVPLFPLWHSRISVLCSCSLHKTQLLFVDVDKPVWSVIEFRRCDLAYIVLFAVVLIDIVVSVVLSL